MRYLALKCSQCSAPLEVAADREQITCGYCGSMLHVTRLQSTAPQGGERPREHPRQAEIDQLDAEWEAYRRESLPINSDGEFTIPDRASCLAGAWLVGIVGGLVTVIALVVKAWIVAGFVAMVSAGLIAVMSKHAKIAPVYERSLQNYQALRCELMEFSSG